MKILLVDKEVASLPGAPSLSTLRAARSRKDSHLDVPEHLRVGNGRGRVRYRASQVKAWFAAHGIDIEGDL